MLWIKHRDSLCYDILYKERLKLKLPCLLYSDHIYNQGLYIIDQLLKQNAKSLKAFINMPQPPEYHEQFTDSNNDLINNQLAYDTVALKKIVEINVAKFNKEQLIVYSAILKKLDDNKNSERLIFIDGPGVSIQFFTSFYL